METLLRLPRDRRVSFPLPDGAFPTVKVTPDQVRAHRSTVASIIEKTVAMEREHRSQELRAIDRDEWKLIQEKNRLRVYKRIRREQAQPMVLCIGNMNGSVSDALFGLHHETDAEMAAVNRITNKHYLDSAVLAVMERGTAADPLHLMALKWRMTATPGVGLIIKNRDLVTLECLGMAVDSHGDEYGYLLLKSVDLPELPPFSTSIAVRAQTVYCCIFRQVAPGTVGIYAKGIVDVGGSLTELIGLGTACDLMFGILKSSKVARAKRLTALAIKSERGFPILEAPSKRSTEAYRATERSQCDPTELSASRSRDDSCPRSQFASRNSRRCAVCHERKSSSARWLGGRPAACHICDQNVCSKCLDKQKLLATSANFSVYCCKGCVLDANELPIDPLQLTPLLWY